MPTHIHHEEAEQLAQSEWPHDSAGRRMIRNVPTTTADRTLADVQKEIKKNIKHLESINYVYVLDPEGKLEGILSLKDVFALPAASKVGQVCKKDLLVMAHPLAHQERVAYLALKHNIKAVPIVDHDHLFLGVIPSDSILQILHKEMHEDLLRRAGIHSGHSHFDDVLNMSLWQSLKHRVPWLFIGLMGGVFAAQIIGFFEATLEENLILAAFIPLIVYMSSAVGTQMEAFIIRDLAIDTHLPFLRYLLKQFFVILLIAIIFSLFLFGVSLLFYSNGIQLSTLLGITLFTAITSSVITGLLVPYGFHRLRMDPANASGPMATIIQDLLSIILYLGIATMML